MNNRNNYHPHPHPYHHPANYVPRGNPPNYFHTTPPVMANYIPPIMNPMPSQHAGTYQTLPPYPPYIYNNPPSNNHPGLHPSLYSNGTNSVTNLHQVSPPSTNLDKDELKKAVFKVLEDEAHNCTKHRNKKKIIIGEGMNVEQIKKKH